MARIELRRCNRTNPESIYIRRDFARNVTSQYGEDGMIAKILELIGIKNRWCVEFGAWDGEYLSNTWDLINNHSWSAVLVEGDKSRATKLAETHLSQVDKIFVKHGLVGWEGKDSLDSILTATPIPCDFDLLSIDIDGNDWHVWDSLKNYRPRLVVIEFNPSASAQVYFVQDRDQSINQGASLLALIELGKSKGYELVACNYVNGMFVLVEDFAKLNIKDNSIEAMYEEYMTTELVQAFDGTMYPVGHTMLTWHEIQLTQEDYQVIPIAMRRYTDPGERR